MYVLFYTGCLSTGKKLHLIRRIAKTESTVVGHSDHILAITISTDGQFLVKISEGEECRLKSENLGLRR